MTIDPALDPTPAAQVAQDVAAEPPSGPASPAPASVQEQPLPLPAGTSPAENGQAAPVVNAAQSKIDQLQKAGFNQQEIGDWTTKTGGRLLAAGFNQDEVNNYLGIKYPDMAPIHAMVQNNLAANPNEQQSPGQEPPTFAANLDKGMGFPVSKVLAGADIGQDTLSPVMRKHLMDCYSKGTANNFTDFIQCAIPAAANAVDPESAPGYIQGLINQFALSTYRQYQGARLAVGNLSGNKELSNEAVQNIQAANQTEAGAAPQPTTMVGKIGYGVASGAAKSLPELLALGVNPILSLAGFGASSGLEETGQVQARGGTPKQAALAGSAAAAINIAGGFLPMKYFTGALGKVGAGEFFSHMLGNSVPSMVAMQLASSAADTAIANPNKTWNDWLKEQPQGIAQAVATGVAFSVAGAGVNQLHVIVHPRVAEAVAPSVGKDPSALTPEDVHQNVAKSAETSDAPHAQAFKDAGLVITGDPAKEDQAADAMRTTYAATGIKPDQIVDDAKTNPEIAADIVSGKVPEAYSHLRDEEGRPVPPEGVRYTDLDPNSPEFADHKQIAKEAGFDLQPYPQGTEAIEHKDDINLSGPAATPEQPDPNQTRIIPNEKFLYQMPREDLEKELENAKTSDNEKLITALGKEGADKFRTLDRAQNSMDTARADRAAEEMKEFAKGFTPEQDRLIYGIGDIGASPDDIKDIIDAHNDSDFGEHDSTSHVERMTANAMMKADPDAVMQVGKNGGSVKDQSSFIRIIKGIKELRDRGIPKEEIAARLVRSAAQNGMAKESDAAELIGNFIDRVESIGGKENNKQSLIASAAIQYAPAASEFAEHAKAYPQTPEGMQQAAKDFVVKNGQETGNEHLVALNENGEATHYSEGSKNSVKIPADLSKKLDDPNNKIIIHHNHPKPVGVGPTDISWLGKPGLEKIIAHTPEGQTSEASLNNQTKNALSWLKPKDKQEVLYKVGEKGFNKSRALISEYIKENDIEVGQDSPLTQVHNEIFNKAMAEAGVTDYNYSDDHSDVLPKTVYDDVLNKTIETIKEGLKEYDVKEQLPGQLGRPGGRSELPAGSETHANEHGNESAVGEAGGAETTEPSATSGNADGSVEQPRERSTLSPEHQDLEDKFGIPEDMNKSQLGKLNKKIEGIFSGKEQDGLPKSADLSDEQFEALEDYGRRVEDAQAALPMSIKQEPAIFGPYTPEEVEQLRREDPDGFSDYVAARRALKQFYSGEKPDMDIRKAEQILSEGREKYGPAFGEAVPTSEPDPENLSSESASINPLAHIFNPANQSEASRDMATALRQAKGPAAHDTALIQEDLRPYAKDTAKLSPEQQMDLINYMENRSKGAEISDPKLQKLADLIRDIYSKMAAKVQETFPDVGLREDYFTHQYKDEGAARKFFSDFVAAQGSERNLRERTFPTLSDAIAAGLEPKTTNPIETVMTYVSNMNNLIAANRAVELAQDFGVADYFKKGQQPDGWAPLNGNLSDKNGKTLYAPEDAARVYNNDISEKASGPVGKILDVIQQTTNFANKLVLGLSGYHFTATTMAAMSSDMGRALTGGTLAERAGDVGKAVIAPISSVLRGSRAINAYLGRDNLSPDMQRSLDLAIKNNAIAVKQQDYWKAGPAKDFVDAWKAGTLLTDAKGVVENIKEHPIIGPPKALIDGIGSTMDTVSKPLFDVYIPRIKNAALLDEIHDWLQKNPDADEKTTDRAVQDIGNSIDNRFGEMMRDNLFWHQYLRQTMQTLFLSYSWMTGAARMLKGIPDAGMAIMGKKGLTSNARYLMGMAVTYAVVNGVRNYIGTGQGPQSWKDLVFPRTGGTNPDGSPEREILPGHTGQFYNYLTEGIGELGNEGSPLLKNTAELITNRDYRNLPITNDNNSWFTEQKWDDYYHHVLDQYEPIGIKTIEKGQKTGSKISTLEAILGARAAKMEISNPEHYKEMMTKVNDREWKRKVSADKKAAAQYKEDGAEDTTNKN